MHVVAMSKLKQFWESRKHDSELAQSKLIAWHKIANDKSLKWSNFGDLKQTFPSADPVGDCVVFDVGNNMYRLIGRVRYGSNRIYVLKIMDHAEYDKKRWVKDCRCHLPPLKADSRKRTTKRAPRARK